LQPAQVIEEYIAKLPQSDDYEDPWTLAYNCQILAAVASHLRDANERRCLSDFAERASRLSRPVLLALMPKIFPAMSRVEGVSGLLQLQRAIEDAGQWFH
jgi:hypothetical protein